MAIAYLHGLPFNEDGRLRVKVGTPTTFVHGGWGVIAADNAVGYVALGAGAVPSDAVFMGGMAFAQNGRLYTTVDQAAGDVYQNGHRMRQDGALVVEAAVPSADVHVAGWAHQKDTHAALIEVIV